MNPVNIRLKALSEKIRKYLSGEDVPDKPLHLSGMKNRLRLMPDGLQTVPDPDFEAAYKKAWDLALEIKQAYIGLPKLPSYESNPDVGIRYLLEWCIDASGGKAGDTTQATPETTKQKAKSVRDLVFIGYSHKDKKWLDDLQIHLKPYVRNGLTAWSDKQIAPGSKWLPEIETALASAKVAVLLVTPNFLASDFIHEKELGPLLKKAEKGKVKIIWIPVRACAYKETLLEDYQAAGDPEKPLEIMKANRNKAWVLICEEIKNCF